MKRIVYFITLFALASSIALAKPKPTPVPAAPVFKGPKIHFFHLKHAFGDQTEGPDIIHVYHFTNIGSQTLKVTNVHTSCGCTAAILTGDTVAPGGEGAIKVTYHTQNRPGQATKTISMDTNDTTSPKPNLEFNVNVIREIDLMPDRAFFYQVRKGQDRSMAVTVLAKKGKPLKILSAETKQKKVTTTLSPFSRDGREGAVLMIIIPASSPYGDFSDEVVLKTTDLKKPEITIPVIGDVVGRVQVSPKTVDLGAATQPLTLAVSVDTPKGFAVRSISTEKRLVKPWVNKLHMVNSFDQYQIVVAPPHTKSMPVGSYADVVHLISNDPERPDIPIPVTGAKN